MALGELAARLGVALQDQSSSKLLELYGTLQDVKTCIASSSDREVKERGDKIVRMLTGALKGVISEPVRRLILGCMRGIFVQDPVRGSLAHGDVMDLLSHSSISSLPDVTVVGLLDVLALHARLFARVNVGHITKTIECAKDLCKSRSQSAVVRAASLATLIAVVEGVGLLLTTGAQAYTGSKAKELRRALKDADAVAAALAARAEPAVRATALRLICRIAEVSPAHLWESKGAGWSSSCELCRKALEDATAPRSVRDAAARALGALAASASAPTAAEFVAALGDKQMKPKVMEQGAELCLLQPLNRAIANNDREAAAYIATSWARYMRIQQVVYNNTDEQMVARATAAIQSLADLQPAASQALGHSLGTGEQPLAQACILFVLQTTVIPCIQEPALRTFLSALVDMGKALLAVAENPQLFSKQLLAQKGALDGRDPGTIPAPLVPQAVVLLCVIERLLRELGEVPPARAAAIRDVVHALMMASDAAVNHAGAEVLGQLAIAEGGSASRLMMEYMSLATLHAAALGSLPGASAASRAEPDAAWRRARSNLLGCALGASALMGAVSITPLGCPSNHLQEMYNMAVRMIKDPMSLGDGRAEERRVGYLLLSCLACNLPMAILETCQDQVLECLTTHALGPTAREAMDLQHYRQRSASEREDAFVREVGWRCAALEACQAWVVGYVGMLRDHQRQRRLCGAIADSLRPVLGLLASSAMLQDPMQAGSGDRMAATMAHFIQGLLDVYLLLPSTTAFAQDHESLARLCLFPIQGPATYCTPASAEGLTACLLGELLDPQDAVLNPCLSGPLQDITQMTQEPLEEDLFRFSGHPGSPQPPTWQLRPLPQPHSHQTARVAHSKSPFPQPVGLAAGLLDTQMRLLGRLLTLVNEANQVQFLEIMLNAVTPAAAVKGKKPEPLLPSKLACVSCAALSGLASIAKVSRASKRTSPAVAACVQRLGLLLLQANAIRPAAEVLSFAAVIGGELTARPLLQFCCEQLRASPPPSGHLQAGYILALGAVHRTVGGIALQRMVAQSISVLVSFALKQAAEGSCHTLALHSLYLVASSAFDFSQYVDETLAVAIQRLLAAPFDEVATRPLVASLANAIVEVQGPEFSPRSRSFAVCQAIMAEMAAENINASPVLEIEATASKRQLVLYSTHMVLFAPNAVPAHQQLPMLGAMLGSKRAALRFAAASSLQLLADRNPEVLIAQNSEEVLMAALDNERDPDVMALLKGALLHVILEASPAQPGPWISLLCSIVQGAPEWRSSGGASRPAGGEDATTEDAAGEEESPPSSPYGAAEPVAVGSGAAEVQAVDQEWEKVPHLTVPSLGCRAFALECLLQLVDTLGADAKHCSAKPEGGAEDLLVDHVGTLVRCSFAIAEGKVESLRVGALVMLSKLIVVFQHVEDPALGDGTLLMEMHVAPFVTAIKSSLKPGVAASVTAEGALLAYRLMHSQILLSDPQSAQSVVNALVERISDFEKEDEVGRSLYAEWVGTQLRVAILHALAQCLLVGFKTASVETEAGFRSQVLLALLPHSRTLLPWWRTLAVDAAVLLFEQPAVHQVLKSPLLPSTSSLTVSKVLPTMAAALPNVLEASAALLAHMAQQSGPALLAGRDDLAAQLRGCYDSSVEAAQLLLITILAPLPMPLDSLDALRALCADVAVVFSTIVNLVSPALQRAGLCTPAIACALLTTLREHVTAAVHSLHAVVHSGDLEEAASWNAVLCVALLGHTAQLLKALADALEATPPDDVDGAGDARADLEASIVQMACVVADLLCPLRALPENRTGAAGDPKIAGLGEGLGALRAPSDTVAYAHRALAYGEYGDFEALPGPAAVPELRASFVGADVSRRSFAGGERSAESDAAVVLCLSACHSLLRFGRAAHAADVLGVMSHISLTQLAVAAEGGGVVRAVQRLMCEQGAAGALHAAAERAGADPEAGRAVERVIVATLASARVLEGKLRAARSPAAAADGAGEAGRDSVLAVFIFALAARLPVGPPPAGAKAPLARGPLEEAASSAIDCVGAALEACVARALTRPDAGELATMTAVLKAAVHHVRGAAGGPAGAPRRLVDELLLSRLAPTGARCAASLLERPCSQHLDAVQCVWNLLLVLTAVSEGGPRRALLGVLIVLVIDALSPRGGPPDAATAAAALVIFKTRLSAGVLADTVKEVLPTLGEGDKARLRAGVASAQAHADAAAKAAAAHAAAKGGQKLGAVKIDMSQFKTS